MPSPDNDNPHHCKPLPWLQSFEVGVKHIDDEHRAMIVAGNALCSVACHGAGAAELHVLIAELVATVEKHFASEEALFPHIGFPGTSQHRAEHEAIRKRMAELLAFCGENCLRPVLEVRAMIVEHILRHDMGYKTWALDASGRTRQ